MTEMDLRETLEHHLGGIDVPPGDPMVAIARGRRRRSLRNGLAAGAATAALLAVPMLMLPGLDDGDRAPDGVTTTPSPPPASAPTSDQTLRYDPSPGVEHPGGTKVEPLAGPVVRTEKGSKTVLLPDPPRGATAVSVSVVCLSPGKLRYPDGSSATCDTDGLSDPADDPRDSGSNLLDLSDPKVVGFPRSTGRTLAFTASPGMSWKLSATYVHTTQIPWGVNAQGQTFGVENDHGTPVLVAVIATTGKDGYAYAADLDGPMPTSPADALAMNDAYPDGRDVPVYESDGLTRIGTFHIEPGSGSAR